MHAGYHSLALGHCEIDFSCDGSVTSFVGKNELLFGRRLCTDASLQTSYDDGLHAKANIFLAAHHNVVVCKKIYSYNIYY